MQRLLTDNMDKISVLCKNHNVRSLFAFGSVVTDKFNDKRPPVCAVADSWAFACRVTRKIAK